MTRTRAPRRLLSTDCLTVGLTGGGAQDLATGFMSGKLLLKLEAVTFLLSHHPAEHFAFLGQRGNMRARPMFYATLARLLFMDDTPAKFHSFVAPLQQAALPPPPLPRPLLPRQGCRHCVL